MSTQEATGTAHIPASSPDKATGEPPSVEAKRAAHRPRRKRRFTFRPRAAWWIYVGIVATCVGFGLIAFAWVKIAALPSVPLQLPYVISAAATGLAVVLVGTTILDFAIRRRDTIERVKQLDQLRDVLKKIADRQELRAADSESTINKEEG